MYHLGLFYRDKLKDLKKSRGCFDKLCSLKYNYKPYWFEQRDVNGYKNSTVRHRSSGNGKLYTHHYKEYGILLYQMRDYEECIKYFEIALEKCCYLDERALIYYYIGLIYDEFYKDVKNAEWYFREAKELDPHQYAIFYKEFTDYHHSNKHIDQNKNKENGTKTSSEFTEFNQMSKASQSKENECLVTKQKNKYLEEDTPVRNDRATNKYLDDDFHHSSKYKVAYV